MANDSIWSELLESIVFILLSPLILIFLLYALFYPSVEFVGKKIKWLYFRR